MISQSQQPPPQSIPILAPMSTSKQDTKATVKLNTGAEIPIIGMGTYAESFDPAVTDAARAWILTSLQAGYRHLDTATMYNTEKAIGAAIQESGIHREELFITTKLAWNRHQFVDESLDTSLKNLGTDHIDLYLMHWPQSVVYEEGNPIPLDSNGFLKLAEETNFKETYAKMEKLLETGKCKAIGVSNFSIKTLEELLTTAKVVPAVNQVELHPYLVQEDLVQYCQSKGIVVTAYTATGKEKVRNDPVIVEIAKKYNATPTQVILSWHLSRGVVVLPKSANEKRQKENLDLPVLEPEDVQRISALDKEDRLSNKHYEAGGKLWGWTYEQLGWKGEARQ